MTTTSYTLVGIKGCPVTDDMLMDLAAQAAPAPNQTVVVPVERGTLKALGHTYRVYTHLDAWSLPSGQHRIVRRSVTGEFQCRTIQAGPTEVHSS